MGAIILSAIYEVKDKKPSLWTLRTHMDTGCYSGRSDENHTLGRLDIFSGDHQSEALAESVGV